MRHVHCSFPIKIEEIFAMTKWKRGATFEFTILVAEGIIGIPTERFNHELYTIY